MRLYHKMVCIGGFIQFAYMACELLGLLAMTELLSQRVCHDLGPGTDCDSHEVSTVASRWMGYALLAGAMTTTVASGTWGPMSDRVGRRPWLVGTCLGLAVKFGWLLVFSAYKGLPMWSIVAAYAVSSVSGSSTLLMLLSFCLVADTALDANERGFGFGVLDSLQCLGLLLGCFLSGPSVSFLGFTTTFAISAGGSVLMALVLLMVPESLAVDARTTWDWQEMNVVWTVWSAVHPSRVGGWTCMCGLGGAMMAAYAGLLCFDSVATQYMQLQFGWSADQISFFSGIRWCARMAGVVLFSRVLGRGAHKVPDTDPEVRAFLRRAGWLTAMALTFQASAMVIYATASQPWIMFVGAVVEGGSSIAFPAIRATYSVSQPDDQQGTVLAGAGAMESLGRLFFPAITSVIYSNTNRTFAGISYFFVAGVLLTGAASALVHTWTQSYNRTYIVPHQQRCVQHRPDHVDEAAGLLQNQS